MWRQRRFVSGQLQSNSAHGILQARDFCNGLKKKKKKSAWRAELTKAPTQRYRRETTAVNSSGVSESITPSATLHNPVTSSSPTSGCQKHHHLPSACLPSTASLGQEKKICRQEKTRRVHILACACSALLVTHGRHPCHIPQDSEGSTDLGRLGAPLSQCSPDLLF